MTPTRRNRITALLCSTAGLVTAWAVHEYPENLRAPAWVAYAACLAFVAVGPVMLAREAPASRSYRWSVVGLLALLIAPPIWIALGPGSRTCSLGFFGINLGSPDLACRIGFGIGLLALGVMLLWAVREAMAGCHVD